MFRRGRVLSGLFVSMVLLGMNVLSSEVLGQKVKTEVIAYTSPALALTADRSVIRPCLGETGGTLVHLNASATSPDGNPITYRWTTEAGRITGDGPLATWDLSGTRPGYYEAFVEIDTGSGDKSCQAFSSTAILVECPPPPPPSCPTVSVICPDKVQAGQPVIFNSTLTGNPGNVTPVFNWIVSGGRIIEGQATNSMKVDTTGMEGQSLTATLSMGGYNLDCSASCSIQFPVPLVCRSFDEFPEIARNEEKARLDNFAIELQNDPFSKGYVIVNPGQNGRSGAAQTRSTKIVDYLVNSRGLDARRIVTVIGAPASDLMVHLSICPQGSVPK